MNHFAMFSTSSSECNCPGSFSFNTTVPNFIGNPFCPATRQPLIYYARIQEPFQLQQNKGNIKDNSNCFMKAFQWYTQERVSDQRNEVASSKVDQSDFAAWLDKKYNEYLKRSQQDGSQLILNESPTINGDKMAKKRKSGKKFGRMRSPWKRHRHTNSKEKGDIPPINQSIEYILQPQKLHKPASECCQRNSGIESSTTIISKESPKCTKIKVQSKSLLCIYRAQEAEINKVKTNSRGKNICECQKNDKGTQYNIVSLESLTTTRKYNRRISKLVKANMGGVITKRYSPQRLSQSNVLCQCSEVDQYEENDTLPLNKYARENGQPNKECQLDSKFHPYCSKMIKTGVIFNTNPENENVSKLQSCTAQTSDFSINFGHNMMYEPLLLKVVHVPK